MNIRLLAYTIMGVIFVFIVGTLSHFLYDWSNQSFLIGLFSPVNESTWEHMKLLFFPMLLWILFMTNKLGDDIPCLTSGFAIGLITGTFAIPMLFYTYSGILGKHYLFLDILVFIISTIIAFINGYRSTTHCRLSNHTRLLKVLVILLMLCFLVFTYLPPDIGIFQTK